jgi:lipopolysaccharide transport system permease protein
MFQDLWMSRGLAWRLFMRDISARYRQSMLGYVWAFLPPVASTLTFILLQRSGVLTSGETSMPYPLYVLIGTILWQVFADAVASPLRTVSAARSMLVRINFPHEALLLSGLLEVLFNFAVRALLLVPIFLYYDMAPAASAPLAMGGVFAIICLGFMIGLLLTPLGLLYTDVSHALAMLLSFWMLVTPVVYTVPGTGALALLSKINPVSPLITTTREWLSLGPAAQVIPAMSVFAVTIAVLFLGWLLFRLTMPILIERMGG